ncbi:MAG TPA: nucleotide exchange factor GrpE [Nitrospirae bacterium]|nr:nucleotide exchange factor GrpE [Nitrospirota bacterium]
MEEEIKIEVLDKRRIKSADDTCDEAGDADLERTPTYVKQLEDKMEENDGRLKEYISAHKEKMAEMDKVRKRLEDDSQRRASDKFGELIAELFPVIDDFDRAIESAKEKSADDPLIKGVEMLRGRLFEALKKQGLEVIDCLDKPFDPEVATAVATIPVDEGDKVDMVVDQMAPGYKFGDRVLRPAMVRVGYKS